MKKVFSIQYLAFSILLYTIYFILYTPSLFAVDMTSPQYRIQFGNINIGSQDLSSQNYNLNTTIGQVGANQFQSAGYIAKLGFQYLRDTLPFQMTVSKTNINLGNLAPSTPSTDTTSLQVTFESALGYQITAAQEKPLKTLTGEIIPNTLCNGSDNACSQTTAKIWNSNSAYGFGYNMSGQGISSDFIDDTYYRPFADESAGNSPVSIMAFQGKGSQHQGIMTFKVNVSPTQVVGSYQTIIHLTAIPSY